MVDQREKPGWNRLSYRKGRMRWVQILPIADLKPHKEDGYECWCNPTVERGPFDEPPRLMVIHNSTDGRELVEQHGVN